MTAYSRDPELWLVSLNVGSFVQMGFTYTVFVIVIVKQHSTVTQAIYKMSCTSSGQKNLRPAPSVSYHMHPNIKVGIKNHTNIFFTNNLHIFITYWRQQPYKISLVYWVAMSLLNLNALMFTLRFITSSIWRSVPCYSEEEKSSL
jgi:hypothetical protein